MEFLFQQEGDDQQSDVFKLEKGSDAHRSSVDNQENGSSVITEDQKDALSASFDPGPPEAEMSAADLILKKLGSAFAKSVSFPAQGSLLNIICLPKSPASKGFLTEIMKNEAIPFFMSDVPLALYLTVRLVLSRTQSALLMDQLLTMYNQDTDALDADQFVIISELTDTQITKRSEMKLLLKKILTLNPRAGNIVQNTFTSFKFN